MGISDAMFSGDPLRRLTEVERQLRNLTSGRRLEDASVGARGVRLFAGGSLTVEGGGNIVVDDEGDIIITGGSLIARDINGETIFAVDTADPASVEMNLGPDGNMTVAGGASVTIGDGGELVLVDANGIEVFKIGQVSFGPDSSAGMRLSFNSGAAAFTLGGTSGDQAWALWDEAGHYLVTNDAVTGTGLARPYLNIPMVPSSGTSVVVGGPFWPAFTNTSYQEVMHCITSLWQPRIAIGVGTNAPSGTVEWQLRVDGVTAGSGSGSSADEFAVPGWGTTTLPGHQRSVQLWARNTSGVQSRVIVDRCYGTQS